MRSFLKIIPLCFGLCLGHSQENQTLHYKTSLEGSDTRTNWTVEKNSDIIEINGQNKGGDVKIEYSSIFNLKHYSETQSNQSSLDIVREENQLIIKSKEKLKRLKLGTFPWIQEFKFGLQPFLSTDQKEFLFCIVYAKDLSLHEMIATKEKEEVLKIGDQTYETQKLKITLNGFKRKFWKAEAWFDLKTHLLVKYRSNEGPGTPHTEVTLIKSS